MHGWCHVKCCRLGASSVYTIQPCTRLQCHFIQSHIGRVYVCLAVTCHLHFWQNDRDLLRATAVTFSAISPLTHIAPCQIGPTVTQSAFSPFPHHVPALSQTDPMVTWSAISLSALVTHTHTHTHTHQKQSKSTLSLSPGDIT